MIATPPNGNQHQRQSLLSVHHRQRRLHTLPSTLRVHQPLIMAMTANETPIRAGLTITSRPPINHARPHHPGFSDHRLRMHIRATLAVLRPTHPQPVAAAESTKTALPIHAQWKHTIVTSKIVGSTIATTILAKTRVLLRGLKNNEHESQDTLVRAHTAGSTTIAIQFEGGRMAGATVVAVVKTETGVESQIDVRKDPIANAIGTRADTTITGASTHANGQLAEMAGRGNYLRPQATPKTDSLPVGLLHLLTANLTVTRTTRLPTSTAPSHL